MLNWPIKSLDATSPSPTFRTSFEEFETLHPWSGLNLEMGSETTLRLGVVVQRWEKNYDDNMVQNSAANATVNSNTANQSV